MSTKKKAAKKAAKKAPKKKAAKKAAKVEVVDTDAEQPKRTEIYILRRFPNPRWLMGEGIDGVAVRVEAPLKHAGRVVGKTIPVVEAVDGAGETYYKYAP